MKWINKSKEPNYLQEYRGRTEPEQPEPNYESFKTDIGLGDISPATDLRKALLDDQGYICAYCMKRIPHSHTEKDVTSDNMKVEHLVAQSTERSKKDKLDITYTNMLACCMGNKGKDEKYETCDTRKKDKPIKISPLEAAHIRTLKYGADGSIYSIDDAFDFEIKTILNLNEDNLKEQRAAIYTSIDKIVKNKFKKYIERKDKNLFLDSLIKLWSSKTDDKFNPFCMVAINYLESRKK